MVDYRKLKQSLKQRVTADIQTQEIKLNHKNTQFKRWRRRKETKSRQDKQKTERW